MTDNIKTMKQNITEEQWNELKIKDKISFISKLKQMPEQEDNYGELYTFRPSIGQMIEFLGDDLSQIDNEVLENQEKIWTIWFDEGRGFGRFSAIELVDVLWEKVKHKLNRKPHKKCPLLSFIKKFKLKQ